MVAKVRDRPTMYKQRLHGFPIERFNLKKLNEIEAKESMFN
jgi:hypothetical protein